LAFNNRLSLDEYESLFLNGVASDVSIALVKDGIFRELRQSYERLQQAQKSMVEQERLNAMGQMASGIAHDINNTLAPIALYTEALLESEEDLSDRAKRFLKTIQDATNDIESTIGRLRLFYRKPEAGETNRQTIDLRQLFAVVVDMTRPRWEDLPQKSGITVELKSELPEGNPTLVGEESEIREALVNLVFNAVDAMPTGGTITLRVTEHDQDIVLEVEDTGTGMTEEQKQRSFEPFYTTKGERGSGLGLSSVFGAMERHQGTVEIESEEGEGTTVRLVFPIRESVEDEQVSQEAPSTLPSLRILCIDDDPKVREGLREILEMDGHAPVVVENGKQGIEAVQESVDDGKDFDVVITDLGMPDMDGWEVAEEIKKLVPETPVILLSGWGNLMNGDVEKPQEVDAILGKPPKMREIRQTLQALLSKRSERTDNDEK
jgi:signal transduction histidine kinase/CheY-like chemotaxis protein